MENYHTCSPYVQHAYCLWIGASKYFRKGAKYVTYFDESFQVIQDDSAVKYRDVDIGSVEKIRVLLPTVLSVAQVFNSTDMVYHEGGTSMLPGTCFLKG